MKNYLIDIKTCESLIRILEDQIARAESGKIFLLPGVTVANQIETWQEKIAEHEGPIAILEKKRLF